MSNSFYLFIIAALGGLAVTIQGQFMGGLNRSFGTSGSVLINYLTGTLVVAAIVLVLNANNLNAKALPSIPWYTLLVGCLGLIVVGSISYTVPRLGLSVAFTVLVASQFISAMVIEHFGWFGANITPIDWSRLAGMLAIIAGVWLITN